MEDSIDANEEFDESAGLRGITKVALPLKRVNIPTIEHSVPSLILTLTASVCVASYIVTACRPDGRGRVCEGRGRAGEEIGRVGVANGRGGESDDVQDEGGDIRDDFLVSF